MREKLIRLQSLYIDQFKRLQHLLKEKKRRYLHNRKVEHEALGKFYASSKKLQWVHHVDLVVVRKSYFCLGIWIEGEVAFEIAYLVARYPYVLLVNLEKHP